MIDKLNLSDEHKKLLEIYKKRNLMEELSFSAYYPTGKQDKQTEGYYKWLCLSAYMKIKELERPKGEWIELSNYRHKCSICNNSADVLANLTEQLSKFCPNCGTQMKNGETDNDKSGTT